MSKKNIYPAIDIRNKKVVRLIQGDYNQQIDYADNPVRVAEGFVRDGATWIHIVDLDGARSGTMYNFEVIGNILALGEVSIQIGGGIRSGEAIRKLLDAGASRVIIGTRGLEDWTWFESVVHNPDFADKIVFGLDARDGKLASHGWEKQTETPATEIAKKVSDWPLAGIVYTDIARDGMLTGPNIEQLELMTKSTKVPIIASGGIGKLEDVKKLLPLNIDGVIIGRAIYENKINLSEAIELAEKPKLSG